MSLKRLVAAVAIAIAVSPVRLTADTTYCCCTRNRKNTARGPETGNLLVAALEKAVAAKGEIAPHIDGRITLK